MKITVSSLEKIAKIIEAAEVVAELANDLGVAAENAYEVAADWGKETDESAQNAAVEVDARETALKVAVLGFLQLLNAPDEPDYTVDVGGEAVHVRLESNDGLFVATHPGRQIQTLGQTAEAAIELMRRFIARDDEPPVRVRATVETALDDNVVCGCGDCDCA